MEEGILARHDREWEEFYKEKENALTQLLSDEWLIRSVYDVDAKKLPAIWSDKFQRDHNTYEQLWGSSGVKQALITHMQWQELDTLVRKAEAKLNFRLKDEFREGIFPPLCCIDDIKEQIEYIRFHYERKKVAKNPFRYLATTVGTALFKIKKTPLQWKKKK